MPWNRSGKEVSERLLANRFIGYEREKKKGTAFNLKLKVQGCCSKLFFLRQNDDMEARAIERARVMSDATTAMHSIGALRSVAGQPKARSSHVAIPIPRPIALILHTSAMESSYRPYRKEDHRRSVFLSTGAAAHQSGVKLNATIIGRERKECEWALACTQPKGCLGRVRPSPATRGFFPPWVRAVDAGQNRCRLKLTARQKHSCNPRRALVRSIFQRWEVFRDVRRHFLCSHMRHDVDRATHRQRQHRTTTEKRKVWIAVAAAQIGHATRSRHDTIRRRKGN